MHYICRSFIGKHNDFSWSQYWENESDDIAIALDKGHIFGLLSFSLKTGDPHITQLGKTIISSLNSHYYSSTDTINNSLTSTLNHLFDTYQDIFTEINVVIAVIHQNQLYLASSGNISAYIFRSSLFSQVLFSQNATIKNINGPLKDLDRIFLTTNNFIEKVSFEKIKNALSQKQLSTTEEIFFSTIYTITNQSDLSSCIIEVHQDSSDSLEEIIPQEEIQESKEFIETPKSELNLSQKESNPFLSKIQKILKKDDVYVDNPSSRTHHFRKKINLGIAFLVIISLTISIFLGYKKNKTIQSQKQFAAIKEEINQKVQTAIAVKNLNLDDSKKAALEAQVLLEKLVLLNVYTEEIDPIKRQIESILAQTGQTIKTDSETAFLEIANVNANGFINKIHTFDNQLLLVGQNNVLTKIDINTKKNISNIKLGISGNLSSLSSSNDQIYFIADNILYLLKSDTPSLKIDFTKADIDAKDFSFWNGILYVLSSKRILKYVSVNDTFNAGSSWLDEASVLNSNPQSISIDSNIWVVNDNGQLQSFTRGIENKINISKENLPLSAKKIIASPQTSNIYILDSNNNIYIYKTSGEVVSKYSYGDKKILDITVNEKKTTLYILCDDQKIYTKSL